MSLRSYCTCLYLSLSFSLPTYAEWTHKLSLLFSTCKLNFPVVVHWDVGGSSKSIELFPFSLNKSYMEHCWIMYRTFALQCFFMLCLPCKFVSTNDMILWKSLRNYLKVCQNWPSPLNQCIYCTRLSTLNHRV